MNPWDIDPALYAPLWRWLLAWLRRRAAMRAARLDKGPRPEGPAGCRS